MNHPVDDEQNAKQQYRGPGDARGSPNRNDVENDQGDAQNEEPLPKRLHLLDPIVPD
jgi:hypothetical protein